MRMILSEEEWFERYYPKDWGDWRKSYNIALHRKQPDASGCCWMDYVTTGYLCNEIDGEMKVMSMKQKDIINRFFIECGSLMDEANVAYIIQPYLQRKDGLYFASVVARKLESNLDLYEIYVSGCDDASYTKQFIGLADLESAVTDLKQYGLSVIQEPDQQYFFTN